MRSVIIVSLAAGVLSGCCGGHPSSASVKGKARVARASSGHRLTYRESGLVRVPDQTHVYKVGRLADGDSMREGGNYYHIEQSAYWNRFTPGSRPLVRTGSAVTSGPSSSSDLAKAYRIVPDDHELTELRNEARADKNKTAEELTKAKLAREKLEGLTQGLAQTDQVIKAAQTEIAQLKTQNDDLRRKAAMKDNQKSDTDFSKIESMRSKQPKREGLQPGPGSDD